MAKPAKTSKKRVNGNLTVLQARTREAQLRRRAAKKQAKEARKLLKQAKKVAKRAKEELQSLSKKLKQLVDAASERANAGPRQRGKPPAKAAAKRKSPSAASATKVESTKRKAAKRSPVKYAGPVAAKPSARVLVSKPARQPRKSRPQRTVEPAASMDDVLVNAIEGSAASEPPEPGKEHG